MKVSWVCFLIIATGDIAAGQSNATQKAFRDAVREAQKRFPTANFVDPSTIKMPDLPGLIRKRDEDIRAIQKRFGQASSSSSTRSETTTPKRSTTAPKLSPIPLKEPRRIEAGLLDSVAIGASKAEVIAQLGDPSTTFALAGLPGGSRETLTYHTDAAALIRIVLTGDRVAKISGR